MTASNHPSTGLLDRYARDDTWIEPDAVWALEAHLETCAACRGRLSSTVADRAPDVTALVDRVFAGLAGEVAASRQMPPRRWLARRWLARRTIRWAAPTLLRYLAMTIVMVLVAVGFDLVARAAGRQPSLVLLVAPVTPLLGVAAVWMRGADPAHELVAATPRAGLYLVLRRTLVVLLAVIPVLAVAGWVVGASPARWLVPCLAFTVSALALGEAIGIPRAAAGLALLWAAAVVAPSLATARLPVVLQPVSLPGWAAVTGAVAVVLVLRWRSYTVPGSTVQD
jgi:Putative zinc-finger